LNSWANRKEKKKVSTKAQKQLRGRGGNGEKLGTTIKKKSKSKPSCHQKK